MNTRFRVSRAAATLLLVLLAPLLVSVALTRAASAASPGKAAFRDPRAKLVEFVGYASLIKLTPAQRQLRDRALGAMPAPCCEKYSMATCCCPCNLAKSVWGLSNYLIARQGADAETVRATVGDWLSLVNPKGFSGDACDVPAGCQRAIAKNGCGGMDERNVIAR